MPRRVHHRNIEPRNVVGHQHDRAAPAACLHPQRIPAREQLLRPRLHADVLLLLRHARKTQRDHPQPCSTWPSRRTTPQRAWQLHWGPGRCANQREPRAGGLETLQAHSARSNAHAHPPGWRARNRAVRSPKTVYCCLAAQGVGLHRPGGLGSNTHRSATPPSTSWPTLACSVPRADAQHARGFSGDGSQGALQRHALVLRPRAPADSSSSRPGGAGLGLGKGQRLGVFVHGVVV